MKRLLALSVCLLFAGILVSAQDKLKIGEDEGKLLALENAWNRAAQTQDVKALGSLMADSLIYIDYDGTLMNKNDFLNFVKADTLQPAQVVTEEVSAKVYGDSAVVVGIYREKGISKGKPYQRRGRFIDTWVKQNGAWLCVASQATLISKP